MTTAYLTLILIIVYYVLGYVSDDNLNDLDHKLLGFLWRKRKPPSRERLKYGIERLILMYSDQQIVTGLAILVAGYAQLRCGSIDAYHWQIMIFTAWFSSLTHLATLSALRSYFRFGNRRARPLRVFLMFCTIGLMIAALVPIADDTWLDLPAVSASYYYHQSEIDQLKNSALRDDFVLSIDTGVNADSVVISILVLVVSYITRVARLFDTLSDFIKKYLADDPSTWVGNTLTRFNKHEWWELWRHILLDIILIQVTASTGFQVYIQLILLGGTRFLLFRALNTRLTCFDSYQQIIWLFLALLWAHRT